MIPAQKKKTDFLMLTFQAMGSLVQGINRIQFGHVELQIVAIHSIRVILRCLNLGAKIVKARDVNWENSTERGQLIHQGR